MKKADKAVKEDEAETRPPIQTWQPADTWIDYTPVWERKRSPYNNPWEIKSYQGSDEKISGVASFPHRKFLRKTPRRWCEVLMYFLAFYMVLVIFSITLYMIFFHIIRNPKDKPVYYDCIEKYRSILVYPELKEGNFEINDCSSLPYILFNKSGDNPIFKKIKDVYTSRLYDTAECTFDTTPQTKKKPCIFDTAQLGPCMTGSTPCFLIRPTRIIDWTPNVYIETSDLPRNFPPDLKEVFKNTNKKERKVIWLSCEGFSEKDRNKIKSIKYHPPTRSFPAYYYPYDQHKNYLDPLVGVELELQPNVKVAINCKIWAKNIDSDNHEVGSILFLFTMA